MSHSKRLKSLQQGRTKEAMAEEIAELQDQHVEYERTLKRLGEDVDTAKQNHVKIQKAWTDEKQALCSTIANRDQRIAFLEGQLHARNQAVLTRATKAADEARDQVYALEGYPGHDTMRRDTSNDYRF